MPVVCEDFVVLVTSELQRCGLFGTAHEGLMLRESLGLPMPLNRYTVICVAQCAAA